MFDTKFNENDLRACVETPYHGEDHSICMRLFYSKFCDKVCTFFPLTCSANLITTIGFVFELISFILTFVYSKGISEPLPSWVCVINGLFLFIYQTCDNVDGRQARRTHSSSAIGQFFDHAVDAFVDVFEMLKLAATLQMGANMKSFLMTFVIAFGYCIAFWNQYVHNLMYLGFLNFCIEGLFIFEITHILVSIDPNFIALKNNIFYQLLLVGGTAVTVVYTVFYMFIKGFVQKKLYTTTMAFLPMFTTTVLTVLNIINDSSVVNNIYFTFGTALTIMYNTQRLVITHITGRRPTRLFDWATICYWLGIVSYLIPQMHHFKQYWFFYSLSIACGMLIFDYQTLTNLSKGLELPIFSMPPKILEELKKSK
ncbi:CDP-alcohol phosphatidyltransferase family protein [Histomonas meleagridis]|uniref:CDP-alcohol phosphatidyltransferase family protein n=1 Tax=Histomonas meleagridis TaxID=135588 RepID=UPI00355A005C|nr:CDP-alcohol phosphatidyltransferase family protein [Histomonas meleagridis]KAH0797630.1 CDP-alcohol phosphatidyltransferase family protein [Histomonas meleagridis]